MRYYVHSEDGQLYAVGLWRDGEYHPGTRGDALREAHLLRAHEPAAYVVGIERRLRGGS